MVVPQIIQINRPFQYKSSKIWDPTYSTEPLSTLDPEFGKTHPKVAMHCNPLQLLMYWQYPSISFQNLWSQICGYQSLANHSESPNTNAKTYWFQTQKRSPFFVGGFPYSPFTKAGLQPVPRLGDRTPSLPCTLVLTTWTLTKPESTPAVFPQLGCEQPSTSTMIVLWNILWNYYLLEYIYICLYIYICICLYIYICIICIYTYIHMWLHVYILYTIVVITLWYIMESLWCLY